MLRQRSIFKDLIRYATVYLLIPLLTRLLSEMHTVFLFMFVITETVCAILKIRDYWLQVTVF